MESIVSEIIGGLMAIFCAVIGAKLATRQSKKKDKTDRLIDSYANLFAALFAAISDRTTENMVSFVAASHRVGLISSPESQNLIEEITDLLCDPEMDTKALAKKVDALQSLAKEDVKRAEGR